MTVPSFILLGLLSAGNTEVPKSYFRSYEIVGLSATHVLVREKFDVGECCDGKPAANCHYPGLSEGEGVRLHLVPFDASRLAAPGLSAGATTFTIYDSVFSTAKCTSDTAAKTALDSAKHSAKAVGIELPQKLVSRIFDYPSVTKDRPTLDTGDCFVGAWSSASCYFDIEGFRGYLYLDVDAPALEQNTNGRLFYDAAGFSGLATITIATSDGFSSRIQQKAHGDIGSSYGLRPLSEIRTETQRALVVRFLRSGVGIGLEDLWVVLVSNSQPKSKK